MVSTRLRSNRAGGRFINQINARRDFGGTSDSGGKRSGSVPQPK